MTILHAVWDDHGGTPLGNAAEVVVTIHDEAPTPPEPWVSIEAGSSSWTEGDDVTFTLTRGNDDITQTRTVDVSVRETEAMLSGSPPTSVDFAADSDTATLMVQTDDDEVDEPDSVITATITVPAGFQISDRQLLATATVMDNDNTPVEDDDTVMCDADSTAVDGSDSLIEDCNTLLGLKDQLRGTATLNWAADTSMNTWDGIVAVAGLPRG